MARSRDPLEELDRGLRALLRGRGGLGALEPLGLDRLDLGDLPRVSRSSWLEADLVGRADISATVGVQVFKEEGGPLRGATALAFGGLRGSGLEGRLTGFMGAVAGPSPSAAFTLRYRGLLEELDVWGGSMTEAGLFEKRVDDSGGEEHVLIEGIRRAAQARAQIAGRAKTDIFISDRGVMGRVESLGTELDLRAIQVLREAQVREAREIATTEARSFVALRAQFESERSRILAMLGE
ncbi:MAG: hypothetical protein LM558_00405 [Thermosphaera sp.]|nr:hypothetical protein [Thermosphaera sp.]